MSAPHASLSVSPLMDGDNFLISDVRSLSCRAGNAAHLQTSEMYRHLGFS